jgi:hypothetical protein
MSHTCSPFVAPPRAQWCLRLLSTLAASMLQSRASWGQGLDATGQLAATLLTGLKPCLLAAHSADLQLLAAQLVAGLCRAAHPRLTCQLIAADLVEYLCELLSGTLGGAGAGAGAAGAARKRRAPGAACGAQAEEVQAHAVVALRHLAYEGE